MKNRNEKTARFTRYSLAIGFLVAFFGTFLVQSASAAYPFPVPFINSQHSFIYFKDLAGAGTIKIFSVSGEQVTEIFVSAGETLKQWPVTSSNGQHLASGVYIYHIDAGGEVSTGKLVVIN